ncbi:hypothetical protein AMK16_12925 [Streptomyces sp. CB00455]|uniref:hypothetical protein n=1 Tax=Streptomyces sp. CB00455 TaxID=1703927 RepID=UPI00093F6749|nr:hypothetical protein [Streptomyces sp. CB00455]OKK19067.1 hypothetical protein AMK16_12925 [Streptomyces sp. CB00455]
MLSMADTAQTAQATGAEDKKQGRKAARLARQIGAFAREHGGAEGHLAHIGQAGTRIVLVGADGAWGDLVAPAFPVAQLAAEKAGLTLHEEFDGEFAARVRTGPYEWTRMAGIQIGGAANPAA